MVCGSRTITDVKWVETQIVNYLKEVYADQEKRFGQGDMDFIIIQGLARGVDIIAKEWTIEACPRLKTEDIPTTSRL